MLGNDFYDFKKLKGQSSNHIVLSGKIGNYKMPKVKPDFCSWLTNRSLVIAPKL